MPDLELAFARRRLLAELLPAVDARRRRRLGVQALAVAALCALAIWLMRRSPAEEPFTPLPTARTSTDPLAAIVVRDDPTILARWRADERLPGDVVVRDAPLDASVRIGDDELLAWLARAGHRNGYVRSGEHFALTRPLGEE